MAGALTVDIVGPDRTLWSGTADRVVVPSVDGEIGLLANHSPLLSLLGAGAVRVSADDGSDERFPIKGGFVSFDHNIVNIVAEPAEPDED